MEMDPHNAQMRDFIYSQIDIKPAMAILDLGCGKGYDLARLAERVDGDSRLVGLDASGPSVVQANAEHGQDVRMTFDCHDFTQGIPYASGSFDLVYSMNMLECVTDKQSLLREVHRVLKPGGQVVFAHFDWDSQLIDGDDKALVRTVTQAFNDWKQDWMADVDAWMGRRLWRTFQQSGLFAGRIETFVLANTKFEAPYYGHARIRDFEALVGRGLVAAEDYEALVAAVASLHERDQFFYSITMYIYVGNRG